MRTHKPVYDVETLSQQPMLATLDPAAIDRLYRQMECQLGHAYNYRSFDNASQSTLTSPLSTMRANSVTTSSVAGSTEDNSN